MENGHTKYLHEILDLAIKSNATDIHFSVSRTPMLRVDGCLVSVENVPVIKDEDTAGIADAIFDTEEQKRQFIKNRDADLSYSFNSKARFRVNIYHQLGSISIAMRLIPAKIRTIEDLSLPDDVRQFAKATQGFFMAVGPAGHGKSAALAAIVNEINHTRQDHIVTIEDPIECVFVEDKCVIEQREVGVDVTGFHRGLREAFRQDPDVIMIGEMRDAETISSAVTAAETGHLVLATLHTNNASQTIDRIIDSFSPHQQKQIRSQLASTILGILSRRLIPKIGGGVINAVELMIANSAVRNLIREGKTHQLEMVIETGSKEGMISLNRSLSDLVNRKMISEENALNYSLNPAELKMVLKSGK